jgi:putative ABC transport system ATP-binding protein
MPDEPRAELESAPAPLAAPVVLEGRALTKVYAMGELEVSALRGVDLVLRRGELVVILGASGSGKSTLLNLLGGLDVPSSGSVWYEGGQLALNDDVALTAYRRRHVGFVFQFYNLVPTLTALENVALVAEMSASPMSAAEALERIGLADRLHHFPSQLSGGQQQRVAIARAIVKRPALLLCDEPTGALDLASGSVVLDAICRVNVELGTSTILITHNEQVAGIADRVVTISDGRVAREDRNASRKPVRDVRW